MHELSLCRSIYGIVEQSAHGRGVGVIHLQVGRMRQVVPDTLKYCWDLVVQSTGLEGSVLEVESMPAVVSCRACGTETHLEDVLMVLCGQCGSTDVAVVGGEQFLLTSIDLVSA
ncbi:hydrogenase maturation nickel metallochaperone HypA [Sporichthya brevicatena]|uniref:Hydrogenase maturation factor HypA n=1 Tax=Sporichthya brevicatena TaxID=171442 RepID=A0ABP3RQI4_9ACTN